MLLEISLLISAKSSFPFEILSSLLGIALQRVTWPQNLQERYYLARKNS